MPKILNLALKIKGDGREGGTCEVLRPCHPPKFGTCTSSLLFDERIVYCLLSRGLCFVNFHDWSFKLSFVLIKSCLER